MSLDEAKGVRFSLGKLGLVESPPHPAREERADLFPRAGRGGVSVTDSIYGRSCSSGRRRQLALALRMLSAGCASWVGASSGTA